MSTLTKFQKKVYKIVSRIPKSRTLTYKQIAKKLHTCPRAVGQALAKNPWLIKISCHRVICANGKPGGYKGNKKSNIKKKIQLLKKEGVILKL